MVEKDIEKVIESLKNICHEHIYLRGEYNETLERLKAKLNQPCVLAVVGRVNSGKSSFLNALLNDDLAVVGDTETTATINIFKRGKPMDANHPIKVVWETGAETFVDRSFTDSLQGIDEQTLERAKGIKWLEYLVDTEDTSFLRDVVLVDTPGTDALVGKDNNAHENVTRNFLQLRNKHAAQTDEYMSGADAVIYLVGPVATKSGYSFLSEFKEAAGASSSLNSLGIMSKIDIDAELTANRDEQAQYVANSLKDQLRTVCPVSASLYQALKLYKTKFPEWKALLARIKPESFKNLTISDETWKENGSGVSQEVLNSLYDDALVLLPLETRESMLTGLPWSVFRTIITCLYEEDAVEDAILKLNNISGIEYVKSLLSEKFFSRANKIRWYKVVTNIEGILYDLEQRALVELQERSILSQKAKTQMDTLCDKDVRQLLEDALKQYLMPQELFFSIKETIKDVRLELESIHAQLELESNADRILHYLETERNTFSEEEYVELSGLCGLYKRTTSEDISARQSYWNYVANCAVNTRVQEIAEFAAEKYGELNKE